MAAGAITKPVDINVGLGSVTVSLGGYGRRDLKLTGKPNDGDETPFACWLEDERGRWIERIGWPQPLNSLSECKRDLDEDPCPRLVIARLTGRDIVSVPFVIRDVPVVK